MIYRVLFISLYLITECESKKKTTTTVMPGTWGQWTAYEENCSQTCGIGIRRRTRPCSYRGRKKALKCTGFGGQIKNCDTKITCPVHGGWTTWAAFGCTVTCGGGDGRQTRTCTNPTPMFNGKKCEGLAEEEGKCNMEKCPDQVYTLSPDTAQAIKNSIDNEHHNLQKKQNEYARIPCTAAVVAKIYQEYPTTTLMWTKNGQVIKIEHERMTVTPTQLTIAKLSALDNGVYVCSVHYAPMVVRPVTVAALTATSSAPDVQVPAEEKMRLLCHGAQLAKIYKNVTQKWLLNNKVVKDFGSESPIQNNVYEVEEVKPDMTGTWTCEIRNPSSGKAWITNAVRVKVLPAIPKILKFLSNRNVLLTIGIIIFVLIMLIGTILGYIITKTREEFMAEFEKWSQIARWEEIKYGGVPEWARDSELLEEDEDETENEM